MKKRLLAVWIVLAAMACTPSPKDVRCSNQGECQKVSSEYGYCVQNRCVQCLDDSGCGEGNVCHDGLCIHKCFDGRDCSSGQICENGFCSDRNGSSR